METMISKKWKSFLWLIKWGAQCVVGVMINASGTVMVTNDPHGAPLRILY